MRFPSLLKSLWDLAGGDPLNATDDWSETFDPIGLILRAPPQHGGHWCTPTNSISFATTGGDGVHYSWVTLPDRDPDFCPIVMTVPMCDTPNVIVGANLREFLCLGCRFGYFSLEQLVYSRTSTIAELVTGQINPEWESTERALADRLRSTLGLAPWKDPGARLKELEAEFYEKLIVSRVGAA